MDSWLNQPKVFRSLIGAQERVDKNSLGAVLTPAGLRRFATRPNSAVGIVCEPLIGSSPSLILRDSWLDQPKVFRSLIGAQERT